MSLTSAGCLEVDRASGAGATLSVVADGGGGVATLSVVAVGSATLAAVAGFPDHPIGCGP